MCHAKECAESDPIRTLYCANFGAMIPNRGEGN
jgi:hypothetical protein